MSATNVKIVKLAWSGCSRAERTALLAEWMPASTPPPATSTSATPTWPKVYSPERVAQLLDKSKRLVFKLSAEGLLEKVTLPGRSRACGFSAASVERLLAGGGAAP